jgi:hypothetical protein
MNRHQYVRYIHSYRHWDLHSIDTFTSCIEIREPGCSENRASLRLCADLAAVWLYVRRKSQRRARKPAHAAAYG